MAEVPKLSRETLAAIANEIVKLKAEHYGKGPLEAKAYQNDDVLVCVMKGGFTTVERTLLRGGNEALVREVRVRFQEQMMESFTGVVERVTGHRVLSYASQVAFDPDIGFELCLLGDRIDGHTEAS